MAKKVVANLQKKESKGLVQLIRSVRSPLTGAYTFSSAMMHVDQVKQSLEGEANT